MCGFVGLVSHTQREDQLIHKVKLMNDLLSHRGPDDEGYFFHKNIGLGHKRLSVIDTSKKASQPMIDSSTGNVLIFNGEIYNFKDLRESLKKNGEVFFSDSDSEIILKQYKNYGIEGLKNCEGMFAFAIWDKSTDKIIIFRDRLGIKPLFYIKEKNFFAFSSEIKSLLALIDKKEINDQAFSEYIFYGNSYRDETIYKNIKSLEPGKILTFENSSKKLSVKNWWKLEDWIENYDEISNNVDDHFFEKSLQIAIDKSVERQLVSDVPLGLFLSGGLDSSTIAASANKFSKKKMKSFIATFDYAKGVNEKEKSFLVANELDLNHEEISISGTQNSIIQSIEKLAYIHDEPFGDAANLPLYLMTKKLKSSIKVILQGDGGDELFSGYKRNKIIANLDILRLIPGFISLPNLMFKKIFFQRINRILNAVSSQNFGEIMAKLLTTETIKDHPFNLFKEEKREHLFKNTNPFKAYMYCNDRFKGFSESKKMMLTDLTLQLPSQFLTKVDRSSMANGIEVRVPLLDENILKLSLNLPDSKLFSRSNDKILIRNILEKRLSKNISRQKKKGFGVPYEFWMRTSLYDYANERLSDKSFLEFFDLDRKKVEDIFFDHKNRIKERGFMLWKLLQLSLWKEQHLEKQT